MERTTRRFIYAFGGVIVSFRIWVVLIVMHFSCSRFIAYKMMLKVIGLQIAYKDALILKIRPSILATLDFLNKSLDLFLFSNEYSP